MIGLGEALILLIAFYFGLKLLFSTSISLALITVVVILVILKINSWQYYWVNRNVPGPKGTFGLGNVSELMCGIFEADMKWKQLYGNTYGTINLGVPEYVTSNMDIVKAVYIKEFDNFVDRESFLPFIVDDKKSILMNGMLLKRGDDWRRIRGISSPAFTTGKMKLFTSLFNQSVQKTIEILKLSEKEDKIVDVRQISEGLTMDSIFKAVFGVMTNVQENPNNEVLVKAKKFFELNIDLTFLMEIMFPNISAYLRIKTGYHLTNNSEIQYFTNMLGKLYERRKKELETNVDLGKEPDFLTLLLKSIDEGDDTDKDDELMFHHASKQQKSKGLSKIEALGQCFLFLLAGYDTTASVLNFLLFLLAHHQDCQDKLREEMRDVIGDRDNKEIRYEDLSKLTYLDQCIKETMRLYPPGSRINRTCVKETEVNGIKFEKGVSVAVPIYHLHYDPDIFPQPETFNPDNFAPENKKQKESFLGFGIGPRFCVGVRFADISIKVYIARLLAQFQFKTCEESVSVPIEVTTKSVIRSVKTLFVKVENFGLIEPAATSELEITPLTKSPKAGQIFKEYADDAGTVTGGFTADIVAPARIVNVSM
uniref:Cytochrome P450 n=1 Tax=Rhabditophanes sp. KR3021 TaxID=114890 RepID=A0AC35TNN3_9BILA